jgi:uncharacterized membrane protein YeaQ/YmgE (transglycosylase-associated protein family)
MFSPVGKLILTLVIVVLSVICAIVGASIGVVSAWLISLLTLNGDSRDLYKAALLGAVGSLGGFWVCFLATHSQQVPMMVAVIGAIAFPALYQLSRPNSVG